MQKGIPIVSYAVAEVLRAVRVESQDTIPTKSELMANTSGLSTSPASGEGDHIGPESQQLPLRKDLQGRHRLLALFRMLRPLRCR